MRTPLLSALLLSASLLGAGDAKAYGKPLTLKAATPVGTILDAPDPLVGKRVRVEGVITDVCESRGCWIEIGGERKGQTILFKVEDGVITFPMTAKGSRVVAEGVVSKRVISVEQLRASAEKAAKAAKKPVDYSGIQGPRTIIRLEGLGAEVQ